MRFMRKEGITDNALRDAVARAARGLIDADLGSGVIKQRVPRPGQGRSGGFRTLIAFKAAERSVFLFGFAKNDQDHIDNAELKVLRSSYETGPHVHRLRRRIQQPRPHRQRR